MSDTIWVLRKSTNEGVDDFDHSLFCHHAEQLDALAVELGVRKLSEFFDYADLQFNTSEEALPESWIAEHQNWHSPADALPSLQALTARLKSGEAHGIDEEIRSGLIEELVDCARKVQTAEDENDGFHFCIVM